MISKAFALFVTGASVATFSGVFFWPDRPPAQATMAAAMPVTGEAVADAMPPAEDAVADVSVYYSGCREVRAAGKAPLHRDQPGYRSGMDGDDDGIACEDYGG